MSFNENNYQLILNYFILLEIYKMDYKKTNNFYLKYFDVLNQKFLNCVFFIKDKEHKKIINKVSDEIILKSKEILSTNKDRILFIYEYDFLWKRKIEEIPFVYFFKGNISLLEKTSFIIEQDFNNKSEFFLQAINCIIENNCNLISLFKKDRYILSDKQLENKSFFNVIGISNLPLHYCFDKKQQELYDYIFENGLIISYVHDMNYVFFKNKNLDSIILGLFADAYIFIDSNNLNEFIESFKLLDKIKRSDYIIRYLLDNKNDDLYKNLKLEFIDSIVEFENKSEMLFHIKNINNVS